MYTKVERDNIGIGRGREKKKSESLERRDYPLLL
jgi:hypothetical protein